MNTVTRVWSFITGDYYEDECYDWSTATSVRIVSVKKYHDRLIMRVTRNTAKECEEEFRGQVSDGWFENDRVSCIEEITV